MGGVIKSIGRMIESLFTGGPTIDISEVERARREQTALLAEQQKTMQEQLAQQTKSMEEQAALQQAELAKQEELLTEARAKEQQRLQETEERKRRQLLAAQRGGRTATFLTRGLVGVPEQPGAKTLLGG